MVWCGVPQVKLVCDVRLQPLRASILHSNPTPLNPPSGVSEGRGSVRTRRLNISNAEERAAVLETNTTVGRRLKDTPFEKLKVDVSKFKIMLDKCGAKSWESCMNMACSDIHVSSACIIEKGVLHIRVLSETNLVAEEGPTHYSVTIQPAVGGRLKGKGRKDKIGVEFYFTCPCECYSKYKVCKHICAVCIKHFH